MASIIKIFSIDINYIFEITKYRSLEYSKPDTGTLKDKRAAELYRPAPTLAYGIHLAP